MVHVYVVAKDPPAILTPVFLGQYVGFYRAGADLTMSIELHGDHLIGARDGRVTHPLSFESPDVAFTPGQPRTRWIFQRDAAGHVTGFVDRREGEDIVWSRVAAPS